MIIQIKSRKNWLKSETAKNVLIFKSQIHKRIKTSASDEIIDI